MHLLDRHFILEDLLCVFYLNNQSIKFERKMSISASVLHIDYPPFPYKCLSKIYVYCTSYLDYLKVIPISSTSDAIVRAKAPWFPKLTLRFYRLKREK
jgi:hypothetical protein